MEQRSYAIGIEVGALTQMLFYSNYLKIMALPEKHIVSFVKRYTTKDIQTGIFNAIQDLIKD